MKRLFFILISFIFYMNCLAQEIIICYTEMLRKTKQ